MDIIRQNTIDNIDQWEFNKIAEFLVRHHPQVHKSVEGTKQTIIGLAESIQPGGYMGTTGFVIFKCNNGYIKIAIDSCILDKLNQQQQ